MNITLNYNSVSENTWFEFNGFSDQYKNIHGHRPRGNLSDRFLLGTDTDRIKLKSALKETA